MFKCFAASKPMEQVSAQLKQKSNSLLIVSGLPGIPISNLRSETSDLYVRSVLRHIGRAIWGCIMGGGRAAFSGREMFRKAHISNMITQGLRGSFTLVSNNKFMRKHIQIFKMTKKEKAILYSWEDKRLSATKLLPAKREPHSRGGSSEKSRPIV